ncbi:MAG: DUF2461 domain-containing protein [Bacteroides sp.]|nr:DUF2461 domain-containing protein [Bacteroides sp.]MCM1414121.1 DUF2461 domain-containing protein [Bacteroides sp.]MCM1470987.1 DUF2461 domain-containing protein [Bacteroides sp.]
MYYVERLYKWFDQLAANNNRPWFEAHRTEYETLRASWLEDLDRMIALMAQFDPTVANQTGKSAAYRIYRDTRFSKDKTPYKTHFSASVCQGGRKSRYAGYYIELGIARTYDQGLYGGLWCVEPQLLRKMRNAIVDNIEEWEEIVNSPQMMQNFPQWCCSTLKTIPKGWDRNHPQAEYLRMTNYGRFRPCDRQWFLDPAWPEKSAEAYSTLYPFIRFLNYTIDE